MQVLLTTAFEVIYHLAIALFLLLFIVSIDTTKTDSSVNTSCLAGVNRDSTVTFATLDWVKAVEDEPVEEVDVFKMAIPRMKATDLKCLARSRGVKGWSKLRKSELILAL